MNLAAVARSLPPGDGRPLVPLRSGGECGIERRGYPVVLEEDRAVGGFVGFHRNSHFYRLEVMSKPWRA